MEQFSLEEYLKNPKRKVVTRDGDSVRIVCTDKINNIKKPIIALVHDVISGTELCYDYYPDGKVYSKQEDSLDLFFVSIKHEGWLNVYCEKDGWYSGGKVYNTNAEAKENASSGCFTTIKIKWEE